ncbi:MAG TPA: hypothetical protein VMH39_01790, partial [Gemmatimonadaceae bacterium]|nr:hypothetical protein [Gemmatimonadaceae bacterium]
PWTSEVTWVLPSLHDVNTVYAAFNNFHRGDFKPYLMKSVDRGKTWTSIASDLPDRNFVWTIAEDQIDKNLLFVGTEFGAFFTVDGGQHWIQFHGGLPTIAVRDIEVQRRENDVVLGTFGRGVWVVDDYTALRALTPEVAAMDAAVLPMRNAIEYPELNWEHGGANDVNAPNPQYGAIISYYLKNTPAGATRLGEDSLLVATIRDAKGKVVRTQSLPAIAGYHRVAWNLRANPEETAAGRGGRGGGAGAGGGGGGGGFGGRGGGAQGPPVPAGKYSMTLERKVDGKLVQVGQPQSFEVLVAPAIPAPVNKK